MDDKCFDSKQERSENSLGSPRPSPGVCSFAEVSPTSIADRKIEDKDDVHSLLNTRISKTGVKGNSADKASETAAPPPPPPSLKTALETLLSLKPGSGEEISNACNTIERAMYGGETTEKSIAQLEPVLVKVLMRHVPSTEAHLTLLEVLRKLCSIGASFKSPQIVQSIMRVLRASKLDASHKLGALSALGALCLSQPEHRARLLSDAENIRAIIRVMRAFEQLPSAQAAGLSALFDLDMTMTSNNSTSIVNAGGARCALRIIRVHSRRAGLVESALNAISQMCAVATQSGRVSLRDAGAAKAAIDALVVHEQNGAIALASVKVLRALGGIASEGVAPGMIPRAVLSAMCAFRRDHRVHVAGLAVLGEMASSVDGAKRVAGAGAAQVVLTTMIEYRTDVEMQQSCVELLSQLVKLAGKDNLECNCEDISKTVSGSVRLYWHDTALMESTAKLLKLLRNKTSD